MRRGARSIRGALGTYAWVCLGVLVVLALVLAFGPDLGGDGGRVQLSQGGRWTGATLDDGARLLELAPGQVLELPRGAYRVTLFGPGGETRRASLEVGAEPVRLDELAER